MEITGCNFFTFVSQSRNFGRCYFLETCVEDTHSGCITSGKCISGENICDDSKIGGTFCVGPHKKMPESVPPWKCTTVQGIPFTANPTRIPIGTKCVQSCASWVSNQLPFTLQSTCLGDGSWSNTRAVLDNMVDIESTVDYPEPDDYYISPNEPMKMCLCDSIPLVWSPGNPHGTPYDPNDEEETDLICDIPLNSTDKELVIQSDNRCRFFCEDVLIDTVQC